MKKLIFILLLTGSICMTSAFAYDDPLEMIREDETNIWNNVSTAGSNISNWVKDYGKCVVTDVAAGAIVGGAPGAVGGIGIGAVDCFEPKPTSVFKEAADAIVDFAEGN